MFNTLTLVFYIQLMETYRSRGCWIIRYCYSDEIYPI